MVLNIMKKYSWLEHFSELKIRFLRIIIIFIAVFVIFYYFKEELYNLILIELKKTGYNNKIIYTNLTEGFFSYINIIGYSSFVIIFPIIMFEIYLFIKPALHKNEQHITILLLLMSPILYWLSNVFIFYFVMPKAFLFFLSFQNETLIIPMMYIAKYGEYINLLIKLSIAFGLCFQLPIILIILNIIGILKVNMLKQYRRIAIIINFVIAGIVTPPDIFSQFMLAIPLILLYEISIITCQFMENRR
jgi:sec-independent protein translocase protein TatC